MSTTDHSSSTPAEMTGQPLQQIVVRNEENQQPWTSTGSAAPKGTDANPTEVRFSSQASITLSPAAQPLCYTSNISILAKSMPLHEKGIGKPQITTRLFVLLTHPSPHPWKPPSDLCQLNAHLLLVKANLILSSKTQSLISAFLWERSTKPVKSLSMTNQSTSDNPYDPNPTPPAPRRTRRHHAPQATYLCPEIHSL